MITVLPILVKLGPWLLAVAGILFGLFRHQQAKADSAAAKAQGAAADEKIAQAQMADAQASEAAQAAANDAGAARTSADSQVAAMPASEVRNELQDWTRGS
ncbi:hypothetical protein [Burkholderia lata]|uniref:Uncharacterized protein n=1 Tax=Burkholderia lata (strain ATCC 17760 / DSM 23089 / LMG 22485 / NCIMB 9086 / R18194 / 383) TaxID=482957 RepID=A0A6P2LGX2_BURL3|nr:hypothetical protein [Burkholderia lata]VWB70721.1 hypothetical protein BLA6863_03317 [Burkholderia lata]